ncbi:MAG: hypothetical protein JGK17_20510 [Microcoleus sp. PH2017_10_PVI_O_A]|uniref:hypothetical protein n=1 Tax=unclassified Microcoleus TaxID=2642155 RepID=UPI001DF0AF98|nr:MULTISPECIES: hypothetical protein [unclassified Microcoleus]MCC3407927.1 hypothetical protein [Microcoleus sp. PH2017_10_PVI_O_A]MCC3462063.1 hypothetical protein [Microcoleus sp. PH2017_11_PCY_U_A]MCC3480531.1 hypothetical protein [Microcoleus sp. PH2017_12_PCY_D_A]MCC3530367.1 hypothetical protein [Microcoleus sp. PH2017_21_RUC_O_A]MCC3542775.1 hypothetical protein [Microcoleus sp. PH2017_22_RUC_O_B]
MLPNSILLPVGIFKPITVTKSQAIASTDFIRATPAHSSQTANNARSSQIRAGQTMKKTLNIIPKKLLAKNYTTHSECLLQIKKVVEQAARPAPHQMMV